MSVPTAPAERRAELATRLAAVRERIARACTAAGRAPSGVTLVVVTKTYPPSDVAVLAELGIRDFAENRDHEAAAKVAALRELGVTDATGIGLCWHFVGQLQRNKAASVASYADVVHSVDRTRLVTALDRAAMAGQRPLDVLVQVDLDEHAGQRGGGQGDGGHERGGVAPAGLGALAQAVTRSQALRLRGLMAVAPLGVPARAAFDRLATLAEGLRSAHPDATWVSAGMSADLEDAVASGATHLRVGSAVLGSRPPRAVTSENVEEWRSRRH